MKVKSILTTIAVMLVATITSITYHNKYTKNIRWHITQAEYWIIKLINQKTVHSFYNFFLFYRVKKKSNFSLSYYSIVYCYEKSVNKDRHSYLSVKYLLQGE